MKDLTHIAQHASNALDARREALRQWQENKKKAVKQPAKKAFVPAAAPGLVEWSFLCVFKHAVLTIGL